MKQGIIDEIVDRKRSYPPSVFDSSRCCDDCLAEFVALQTAENAHDAVCEIWGENEQEYDDCLANQRCPPDLPCSTEKRFLGFHHCVIDDCAVRPDNHAWAGRLGP
jgi:hypothetical protein